MNDRVTKSGKGRGQVCQQQTGQTHTHTELNQVQKKGNQIFSLIKEQEYKNLK